MKRDMDLVRKILLKLEEDTDTGMVINFTIDGYEPDLVSYHVYLLSDAGLLHAKNVSDLTYFEWAPSFLTWAGHEFLDASREEGRWQKAKKMVMEKTGGLSF